MNEADFLSQVRDAALLRSWLFYHTRFSLGSDKGWLDTALIRPPRLVLAELKTQRGKLTLEQSMTRDALSECTSVEAYVWRPADLEDVVKRVLA